MQSRDTDARPVTALANNAAATAQWKKQLRLEANDLFHEFQELPHILMKNDPNPYSVPADTNMTTVTPLPVSHNESGRYGVILLAIAWAWWGWLLSDIWRKPVGDLVALLVFASVTLTAGVCGHLLYCYVLKWRGTVLISLLLGPLPVLGLLGLLFGSY